MNSFRLGYIVGKNQRVTISNNSNLDEVYSSSKNGWITLWAEPIVKKEAKSLRGTKCMHSDILLDHSNEGTYAYLINHSEETFINVVYVCNSMLLLMRTRALQLDSKFIPVYSKICI